MLNNISWASYWTALSIIGFLYYAAVLLLYYRHDLLKRLYRLKQGMDGSSSAAELTLQEHAMELMEAAGETGGTARIRELLLQLQPAIEQSGKQVSTPEMLTLIQPILRLYQDLFNSQVKDKIIDYIKILCKAHCSVHLSREEISALWNQ